MSGLKSKENKVNYFEIKKKCEQRRNKETEIWTSSRLGSSKRSKVGKKKVNGTQKKKEMMLFSIQFVIVTVE